jgi:hypothetical protein
MRGELLRGLRYFILWLTVGLVWWGLVSLTHGSRDTGHANEDPARLRALAEYIEARATDHGTRKA